MNLPKIHLNSTTTTNRRMSCSTNSKSTYSLSTSSSNKFKQLNPIPVLIQLCKYPDENYAYRTMRLLLSSRHQYSVNVCDEFGCNVLMYALRYQRYRLFEFLLNDISLDLNFHATDRHGNTILHYAILYSGNEIKILEKLIEKYKKFAIQIDERNNFGFTPLLLATFCGRYDFILTLLTKTDASPFVRDHIQLKNMFDYIEIDLENQKKPQISYLDSETNRLNHQLHQTIPCRQRTYLHKNFFFELFLPEFIQDQSGIFRCLILQLFHFNYLTNLLNYLNQRYPRIKTPRRIKETSTIKSIYQRENSKIDLHYILNLFDPELKPKAIPPPAPPPPEDLIPITKAPMSFKRLSTKLTTIAAFSKVQVGKKRSSLTTTNVK